MTSKAIETSYNGYRFRSRAEARFAILLDAMGIDWDYEPEGFELPSGWYLPDFFVRYPESSNQAKRWPGAGYWVEIKGAIPTPHEERLCFELSKESEHRAWIFHGGLGSHGRAKEAKSKDAVKKQLTKEAKDFVNHGRKIIRNHEAGEIKFSAPISCCYDGDNDFTDRFYKALAIARSARFEHGETPHV